MVSRDTLVDSDPADVRRLRSAGIEPFYSTSSDDMLHTLLAPALRASVTYDRAAGYFSSSIFSLIPLAFSDFVERGGRIRLICSPHLSEADAKALQGQTGAGVPSVDAMATQALKALCAGTDLERSGTSFLRALLDAGALQIKFAFYRGTAGLFHDKSAVLCDSYGDQIAFTGSANETAAAWSGIQNHENVQVFRSWEMTDKFRVDHEFNVFEQIWDGLRPQLTVVPATTSASIVRDNTSAVQWELAADQLRHVIERSRAKESIARLSLRNYQTQVLDAWQAQDHVGIVTFATGGGKTRTALEAVRRWIIADRPALVLVPSALLHQQWMDEIGSLFPSIPLLPCGAGWRRARWEETLATFTADETSFGPRIVLATYQTASSSDFLARLQDGQHLLIVGDEVHVAGAARIRYALETITSGASLGLSATPERAGDPAGSQFVVDRFGQTLEPAFGITEALAAGVLVPYTYNFESVSLTPEESDAWADLSHRISVMIAANDGALSEAAKLLLIRRARISKRAAGKAAIARRLVEEHWRAGDRWLLYCSDLEHLSGGQSQ